jgi:cbb3-type cytochrome oxidase maturation protein
MSVLFILIGASVLVASGFLIAFISSVRSGQYDDNYTPSVRMLFEQPTSSSTLPASSEAPAASEESITNP